MASFVVLALLSPLLISIAFALPAKGRGLGAKLLFVLLCTVGSFALLSGLGELLLLALTPERIAAISEQFVRWRYEGYYERYLPMRWLPSLADWFVQWWWILFWLAYPLTALLISYLLGKFWLQRAPQARQ